MSHVKILDMYSILKTLNRNDSYSVPLVNVANAAEKWVPHLMGALTYICVLVPLLRTSDFSGF